MRDEHADACPCPRCNPPRLVFAQTGDKRQPLAQAINAKMPAVLARDLREAFAPVTEACPLLDAELARLDAALGG